MQTITDITLNQINAALLSLKRDNENLYKLVFDLKTSTAELKEEIEQIRSQAVSTQAEEPAVQSEE